MSEVPIKEERGGVLPAAVEMNAEETAGAARTYQRQCNVIPTGQQPPMPVTNNDQQVQYIPNISMPSMGMEYQYLPQQYYTVDYSPYLPPNAGPGHPQAVMGVMTPSSSSALVSRRPADDQGKRAQRLYKNREAAKQSRARKKHYHENIKARLNDLEADNKMLRERLSYLTQPNVYSNATLPLLPSYGGQ